MMKMIRRIHLKRNLKRIKSDLKWWLFYRGYKWSDFKRHNRIKLAHLLLNIPYTKYPNDALIRECRLKL